MAIICLMERDTQDGVVPVFHSWVFIIRSTIGHIVVTTGFSVENRQEQYPRQPSNTPDLS